MSAKSFFSKIFGMKSNKNKLKDISAQKALLLQKDYIDNLSRKKSDLFTPPFMEIAKQLSSEKQEIFRAAVFYLVNIAKNETQYTADILQILNAELKKKHSSDDANFLQAQINKLNRE